MSPEQIFVVQGEFHVAKPTDPSFTLTTLLGSCISTCLYDPQLGAGGMNHFLVANARSGSVGAGSYGVNAMEMLINAMLRLGADRSRLRAHVFGGAAVVAGLSRVGEDNAIFCKNFLQNEGIEIVGQSTGGKQPRRVTFWPANGEVTERLVAQRVPETIDPPPPSAGTVELF